MANCAVSVSEVRLNSDLSGLQKSLSDNLNIITLLPCPTATQESCTVRPQESCTVRPQETCTNHWVGPQRVSTPVTGDCC